MRTLTPELETRRINYLQQKIEDSYFSVSKNPMGDSDKFAIVNRETGAKLSEVSKRYTIVRNQDIFQPFIKRFGYENITKFYGYGGNFGNQKYYYMEIKTGRRFNFGTEENPDWIEETLNIANSYNKTKSFSFKLGAFRWVCSNGLHSGQAIVNYKKIHVGVIPVQKLVFETMLKFQDNAFDNWKRLKAIPLSKEQRIKLIENMTIFNETNKDGEPIDSNRRLNWYIKGTAIRKINNNSNEVDNQPNGWGLYNQINWAIDREIQGNSQIEKRIRANNIAENYLLENTQEEGREEILGLA